MGGVSKETSLGLLWAGSPQPGRWDGTTSRQGAIYRTRAGGRARARGRAITCSTHIPELGIGSMGSSLPTEPEPITGMYREWIAALSWVPELCCHHPIIPAPNLVLLTPPTPRHHSARLQPHSIHLDEHTLSLGVPSGSPWRPYSPTTGVGCMDSRSGAGVGGQPGSSSRKCEGRTNCWHRGYQETKSGHRATPLSSPVEYSSWHAQEPHARIEQDAFCTRQHFNTRGPMRLATCAMAGLPSPSLGQMGPRNPQQATQNQLVGQIWTAAHIIYVPLPAHPRRSIASMLPLLEKGYRTKWTNGRPSMVRLTFLCSLSHMVRSTCLQGQ